MGFEKDRNFEKVSQKPSKKRASLTLQNAIELGEYNPKFLSTFPEWHTLSRYIQFQYIRQGIDNRHKQLITQLAEVNNMLDFSKRPHIS